MTKTCVTCNSKFETEYHTKKYCSRKCSLKYSNEKYKSKSKQTVNNTGFFSWCEYAGKTVIV